MDSKKEQLIEEIAQISKSVSEKADLLDEELSERYASVKKTLDNTLTTVTIATKALAPALLIRSHPWIATGSALVGGFLLAKKMTKERRDARWREVDSLPYNPASYDEGSETAETQRPRQASAFVEKPGFLARHPNEVRAVKNLALTALTRFAASKLKVRMPHLSEQISLAEVSVTSLLK